MKISSQIFQLNNLFFKESSFFLHNFHLVLIFINNLKFSPFFGQRVRLCHCEMDFGENLNNIDNEMLPS